MKVIIDIPKDLYDFICSENVIVHNGKKSEKSVMAILLKAIKNSTPIPKGCGRLIEANTIQSIAKKKAENCFPEGKYDYGYRKALFEFTKDIDDAPTIIETDKEGD